MTHAIDHLPAKGCCQRAWGMQYNTSSSRTAIPAIGIRNTRILSPKGGHVGKRPLTIGYIIFLVLFSPDTWRILIGLAVALFLAPTIIQPHHGVMGAGVIYFMLASIGYAFSAKPGHWIGGTFKKLFLGDRQT